MKRLDITTRRSEVFFTGRKRLRGTLIPERKGGIGERESRERERERGVREKEGERVRKGGG